MNLKDLQDFLMEAHKRINEDTPALARMQLAGALSIVRPLKDQDKQTKVMFVTLTFLNMNLRDRWYKKGTKQSTLKKLEKLTLEVQDLCEQRRAA